MAPTSISPWASAPWTDDQQQLNPAMAQEPAAPQVQQVFAAPPKSSPLQDNITNDQQQLQKVRWNQANPWGTPENHPGALGKAAHVFSQIGNVAGDIFAPHLMANIPGTEANMQMKEGELTNRLNAEEGERAKNEEAGAQTAKANEETAEAPKSNAAREGLEKAQTESLENKPSNEPTLAQGYAHAVNQAIKEGRDPAQDPIVQHLSDAITSLQKQPAAPKEATPQQQVYDSLVKGGMKPEQALEKIKERPPVVNVNAGIAGLDRESKQFGTSHQKAADAASTQLEKIEDAKSMINGSAEAQALGVPKVLTALVSGAGSGVRITQPELNAIAKARGLSGDVEGTLNSWAGKGKLTSTQQHQLSGLLDDVKARITEKAKIHNDALDTINGAGSRDQIIQADKDARQKISDLEQHGHYAGQEVHLKNGQTVVVQKVHPDGSFD